MWCFCICIFVSAIFRICCRLQWWLRWFYVVLELPKLSNANPLLEKGVTVSVIVILLGCSTCRCIEMNAIYLVNCATLLSVLILLALIASYLSTVLDIFYINVCIWAAAECCFIFVITVTRIQLSPLQMRFGLVLSLLTYIVCITRRLLQMSLK